MEKGKLQGRIACLGNQGPEQKDGCQENLGERKG